MTGPSQIEGRGRRVLVGLSGGVDSAVAALLLKERGFEVICARMKVYDGPDDPALAYGCYGRGADDDEKSARAMAKALGLEFRVLPCADPWRELVLDYFRAEYLAGRTPNPCVRCNEAVKFGLFPRLAEALGLKFDFFATGHYVRLAADPDSGRLTLKRAADAAKDQSYFLYRLKAESLSRLIFPLGDFSKEEVRALARSAGLKAHDRPDSQDFYGGNYVDLLDQPDRPGNIVDSAGKVLGRHQGFWRYTPGQRKGLGVCGPEPLYVLKIRPKENEVVVGPAAENNFEGCLAEDLNFFLPLPAPGAELMAKMRSAQPLQPVTAEGLDEAGRLKVDFKKSLSGLAPGQSLVLYRDDLVVGGGIISGDFLSRP